MRIFKLIEAYNLPSILSILLPFGLQRDLQFFVYDKFDTASFLQIFLHVKSHLVVIAGDPQLIVYHWRPHGWSCLDGFAEIGHHWRSKTIFYLCLLALIEDR